MRLENIVKELKKVEREIDKKAKKLAESELSTTKMELERAKLYDLSETLRKARLEIEHVFDVLDSIGPEIGDVAAPGIRHPG